MTKKIFVTKPSLNELSDVIGYLHQIWNNGIMTHNGPLVQQFENETINKLDLKNLVSCTNGTIAIQMAIKALNLSGGEIITTPFTWIATISAIKWENCKPVFCDIDPETLNIDVSKIENKITNKTVAIMPVHVFGNPCDIEAIEKIAKKHNLKVIYDAAHAVGSSYKGSSVLNYGDISCTSFHATKLLNTAEGGGCIAKNNELELKLKRIRFFGHDDNNEIIEDGTNGKLTEVHAAIGISNLKILDEILKDRKHKYQLYKQLLSVNSNFQFQKIDESGCNYSYFPIIFESESLLLNVINKLNQSNIFPRRYFYPSVNTYNRILDYQKCEVSESVSKRILCLPLYLDLNENKIIEIVKIILENE